MTELGPATPFTSALPSTSLFIARDREIEQIKSVFASGVRLVLITGIGTIISKPILVHFSGHGSRKGEIVLEDKIGNSTPVTAEALRKTISGS